MSAAAESSNPIAWWREPTKDQWLAWVAAWLGWTLDAFDFTIFLLIMAPIAAEFQVPLTAMSISSVVEPAPPPVGLVRPSATCKVRS